MLNVLLNAYAVSPNWGSEPGLGWNWIVNLSKYCNVFVITEGEWKDEISEALAKLPQKENIHFFYNPVPERVRNICWNQGDWRFYMYYRKWQNRSLEIAKEVISTNRIDIIHQLNMIGFREPGSLWKIKDIPFVWGPIGGYGWNTLKYLEGESFGTKMKAILKNILNYFQSRYYPLSNQAMKRADCVLAANSNVFDFIKKHHRDDVYLLNETGCYEKKIPLLKKERDDVFRILWVGKFDYRKQLGIAIKTIALLKDKHPNILLEIVGDTLNPNYFRFTELISNLKLQKYIKWHGKIPNSQVHQMMQQSDLFLFTSIDEGTPHVVLEAIQNNLPVICFDTCGQGDVVDETVGIKIPLSNAKKSPEDFANAISNVIEDSSVLPRMKQACGVYQTKLSWDTKIRTVINIYRKLIAEETNKTEN